MPQTSVDPGFSGFQWTSLPCLTRSKQSVPGKSPEQSEASVGRAPERLGPEQTGRPERKPSTPAPEDFGRRMLCAVNSLGLPSSPEFREHRRDFLADWQSPNFADPAF